MNKAGLIKEIGKETGFSQKDVKAVIDALDVVVPTVLASGEDVALMAGLKLTIKEVAERRGTIQLGDRKGEEYVTPAHKAVKAKIGKALKDLEIQ